MYIILPLELWIYNGSLGKMLYYNQGSWVYALRNELISMQNALKSDKICTKKSKITSWKFKWKKKNTTHIF